MLTTITISISVDSTVVISSDYCDYSRLSSRLPLPPDDEDVRNFLEELRRESLEAIRERAQIYEDFCRQRVMLLSYESRRQVSHFPLRQPCWSARRWKSLT